MAHFHIARFYEIGRGGLPKDEKEAIRLYEVAAKAGLRVAKERLKELGH
jgi:TPR repeat protein